MTDAELRVHANEFSLNRFDYEIERHLTPEYIEIVGCIGGDILTYRLYRDGSIGAK